MKPEALTKSSTLAVFDRIRNTHPGIVLRPANGSTISRKRRENYLSLSEANARRLSAASWC